MGEGEDPPQAVVVGSGQQGGDVLAEGRLHHRIAAQLRLPLHPIPQNIEGIEELNGRGFSGQRVPSLSNTASRSAAGTKSGLVASLTRRT